jgi:hypothetical protein
MRDPKANGTVHVTKYNNERRRKYDDGYGYHISIITGALLRASNMTEVNIMSLDCIDTARLVLLRDGVVMVKRSPQFMLLQHNDILNDNLVDAASKHIAVCNVYNPYALTLASMFYPTAECVESECFVRRVGKDGTEWHTDADHYQQNPQLGIRPDAMFTIWIALSPIVKKVSCMRFVIGSHHGKTKCTKHSAIVSQMEIGDSLIFLGSTLHGATCGELRNSFDARFNIT